LSPDRAARHPRLQRGKSLVARPRPRTPRKVIYVVAEGELTEYDYCTALNNSYSQLHSFRIDFQRRSNGLKPIEVAEHALAAAARLHEERSGPPGGSPNPVVWALFDRDQHPKIPEAIATLSGHEDIYVAFSHPSFDLWLLLHFSQASGAQSGSSQIVHSRLRSCPGFETFGSRDKRITASRAAELMARDRITAAVRHARALVASCPTGSCSASDGHSAYCDPLCRDPSTDMWCLIDYLGIT
jgi:hypothetical protein